MIVRIDSELIHDRSKLRDVKTSLLASPTQRPREIKIKIKILTSLSTANMSLNLYIDREVLTYEHSNYFFSSTINIASPAFTFLLAQQSAA